jgi:hypothetical protein
MCLICHRHDELGVVCPDCLQQDRTDIRKMVWKYMMIKEAVGADIGRIVAEYLLNFFAAKKGPPL